MYMDPTKLWGFLTSLYNAGNDFEMLPLQLWHIYKLKIFGLISFILSTLSEGGFVSNTKANA